MLDSTHSENIKKTGKTVTSTVDTNTLCVCQNIPLNDHRDSTKNHPEEGKLVLPIQEILQNYYSIKSSEGTKTLKTSFRMPNDTLFQRRFFFVLFVWNFKENCDIR